MSNPVRVRTIDQCPKQHPLPKPCRHSMDSQTSLALPLKIATKKKRKEKKKKAEEKKKNVSKDVEKFEPLCTTGGSVK